MKTLGIFIYVIVGFGFGVLAEDSQPDIVRRYKILRGISLLWFMFLWLPHVLLCMCFKDRDIWFKKSND